MIWIKQNTFSSRVFDRNMYQVGTQWKILNGVCKDNCLVVDFKQGMYGRHFARGEKQMSEQQKSPSGLVQLEPQ